MSTEKGKNSDLFVQRLISLMENAGISKAQLARELGVSNAHVANWLNGQMPRAEHLLSIARHFEITIEWLLSEEVAPSVEGGPGNLPLFNPVVGRRELSRKADQLVGEANLFRQMAERHQGEAAEFLAKAEAYEEWAKSILEPDDFEEDDDDLD